MELLIVQLTPHSQLFSKAALDGIQVGQSLTVAAVAQVAALAQACAMIGSPGQPPASLPSQPGYCHAPTGNSEPWVGHAAHAPGRPASSPLAEFSDHNKTLQ